MANPAVNETISLTGTLVTVYNNGRVTSAPQGGMSISERQISLTVKTAAWKLRQQGIPVFVPPTAYQARYYRRTVNLQKQTYPDAKFGWVRSGKWEVTGGMPPAATSAMMNSTLQAAEAKALNKLKNQQVNFAQFFAEGKQTIDLLKSTATRLTKGVLAVKKGNVVQALRELGIAGSSRQVRRTANRISRKVKTSRRQAQAAGEVWSASKQAANTWLECSFGWLPLLDDLNGAAKLMADRAVADPNRQRFFVVHNTKRGVPPRGSSNAGLSWYATVDQSGFYGSKIRLDFRFSNVALASAAADGLANPAALAWELLPFSFCADYVINIGGWLQNLDASLGKEFIGGSVTLYRDWERKVSITFGGDTFGSGGWSEREKFVFRNVYYGFPSAVNLALQVKNPLNSAKRIGNVLSLLRQAFND